MSRIIDRIHQNTDDQASCKTPAQRLALPCSVFLSWSVITGLFFDHDIPYAKMTPVGFLFYLIFIAVLCPVIFITWNLVLRLIKSISERHSGQITASKKIHPGQFAFAFFIIMAAWIIVWLAYYPGLWNYDPWQVFEYLEHDYSKHYPLIHTLLLGWCYDIGGRGNGGVILYDIIQMIFMSAVYALCYAYIRSRWSGRVLSVITLIFFALFPAHPIMAISSTKDPIFSALIVLGTILTLVFFQKKGKLLLWQRIVLGGAIALTIIFIALFRNNAIYAVAIALLVAIVLPLRSKKTGVGWRVPVFLLICMIAYFATDAALTTTLDAKKTNMNEMLSIPIQQMGRIREYCDDERSNEIISWYISEDSEYDPYISDPLKGNMKYSATSATDLIQIVRSSARLFTLHPLVSIDSFLYLTKGDWHLSDTSYASIYNADRQGYLMTDVKEGYRIVSDSRIPWLQNVYERIVTDNVFINIPVLRLIFAPALYICLTIFCLLMSLLSRRYERVVILTFFAGLILTILAGPCCVVRYAYPYMAAAPLMILLLLSSQDIANKNSK